MRSVLANYLWLSIGDTGSRVLLFGATLYLGTTLGATAFGRVSFAQAIVVYFLWLAHMGLPLLGARAVARDRQVIARLTGRVLILRLLLAAVGFMLLVGLTFTSVRLAEMRGLLLGFGLWLFPTALLLDWVFQGAENTRPPGLARLLDRLLYAALIVCLVRGAGDERYVPWAWLAGAWLGTATLGLAFRRAGWGLRLGGGDLAARRLLWEAFPLGLSFLMIQVYLTLDTVMIGVLRSSSPGGAYGEVGIYTAAYKVVQFLLAFAALTGAVLFPVLARLGAESRAAMQPVLRAASRMTLAAGLPLAVGGMLLAEPLMGLAWGADYRIPSAVPFAVLIWSVFTVFVNVPYATILLATGGERRYLVVVSSGAVVNVLGNLFLIPRHGLLGAATATMISELVVVTLFFVATRGRVERNPAVDLLRPLLAVALMAGTIILLRGSPAVAGLVGAVVYVVAIVLFRQITPADLNVLRRPMPASES